MSDAAVHLEESVLPTVRVRRWICTLPWGLRALLRRHVTVSGVLTGLGASIASTTGGVTGTVTLRAP